MTTQTYTNDGETKYEAVYEVPDDADDEYTVWLESDDDKIGVDFATFQSEWREWGYGDHMANNLTPTQRRN